MKNVEKCLVDISNFNRRVGSPKDSWKVFPELCHVYNSDNRSTTFVKEVMDWCRKNGTIDRTQSAEEAGALGQCYIVNGVKLLSNFGFRLK